MTIDSTNGRCSLFLCPGQHDYTLADNNTLVSLLQSIGFTSKQISTGETQHRYFTGEHFLNYVSYMGCAPTIQFEASETNPEFCFIEIHRYDSAKLIHSKKQARAPHCPTCNKPVKDWQQHLTTKTKKTEIEMETTIFCEACNTSSRIELFNWRKMGGYASLFIEISDIFPKEAIPQPALMDKLTDAFDSEWIYFYSCR